MTDRPDDLVGDGDLYEPALRRALAHAPDHASVPKFHIGKSIRQMAHDAVGPSDEEMTVALDRSWWRQLFGGGKSRMPWNAAFATVLVGVLVTFLWQREPVPGPQLDGQASPPVSTSAPVAPAAPTSPPASGASAAPQAAKSGASAEAAASDAASTPEPTIALPPTVAEAPELPPEAPPELPPLPFQLNLPAPAAPPPPPPPSPSPSPSPSPAAPARRDAAASPELKKSGRAELAASTGAVMEREAASRAAPAPAPAQRAIGAANNAAGSASSSAIAELPRQPTFSALSQWTRLTVVPANGETRSFTRDDGRQLGVLVGSAALSAVGQQPLHSRVEWRITLERDGKSLAQLELARGEVRWRENGLPATTGQPPEGALDGLRDALREITAPAQAPAGAATPAPQPGAQPAPPR